jgi:2-phospho-L-lactate guanylyltransferase (CobY/MobA/RfbA family)
VFSGKACLRSRLADTLSAPRRPSVITISLGHVVAVLTYASAERVIREALITCDDAKQAQLLRSYADSERTVTREPSGAIKISISQSYPSPPNTIAITIPVAKDDLDVTHAQAPARIHVAAWKRQ